MLEGVNLELVFAILFGLSEVLGLIPGIKSNGVFQLVYNILVAVKDKFVPSKT